jgi:hypothetical protein
MPLRSCLLLVTALLAAPAAADVVATTDGTFVSHVEARVPATPAQVWAELLAPARWWDPAHTWSGQAAGLYLDAQATGCFCELLPLPEGAEPGARRGSVEHLHVIHVAPERLLRMTGGLGPLQSEPVSAVLTISLKPEGTGTLIAFDYRVAGLITLKGGEIAGPVDQVLSAQIARLAARSGQPSTFEGGTPAGQTRPVP